MEVAAQMDVSGGKHWPIRTCGLSKGSWKYEWIQAWHEILLQCQGFLDSDEGEYPWDNVQVSDVSLLASAAFRAGGGALIETYAAKPPNRTETKARSEWQGWNDLWINNPSDGEFIFEAERVSWELGKSGLKKKITAALRKSEYDLRKVPDAEAYDNEYVLAIIVPEPGIQSRKDRKHLDTEVNKFERTCIGMTSSSGFSAVHFGPESNIDKAEHCHVIGLVAQRVDRNSCLEKT